VKQLLIFMVRAYQATLGPLLGGACRFHPSCSQYAIEAIERHGVRHGGRLAAKRLAKCHPFGAGGYDPVPECSGGLQAGTGTASAHLKVASTLERAQ